MKKNIYTLVVILVAVGAIVWLGSAVGNKEVSVIDTEMNNEMHDDAVAENEKTSTTGNTTVSKPKPTSGNTTVTPPPTPAPTDFNPYSIESVSGYSAEYPDRGYVNFYVKAKQFNGEVADDVDGYLVSADLRDSSGKFVAAAISTYDRVTESWKVYFNEPVRTGQYVVNVTLSCRVTNSINKLTCAEEYGTTHTDIELFNISVN